MNRMVFRWRRPGLLPLDAQAVGEHLEAVRRRTNRALTPEAVLADAALADSPLHPAFEWDDGAAAHQHRLSQARELIAAIVVVGPAASAPDWVAPRAIVAVGGAPEPDYPRRGLALSDVEQRRRLLDQAWRDLLLWRERYQDLPELRPIVEAIDVAKKARPAA